jgi:hypothetical protein
MSHSILRLLGAALLTLTSVAQADKPHQVPEPGEPGALLSEIDASGPKAVLARLWADEPHFEAICGQIATGNAQWLEVARRLRSVSDAAITLSLNYSVARALPVAPVRVLGLVDHGFLIDDICTSPYIEPEPGVAEAYEARALKALASLRGTKLSSLAEQCAAGIRLPSH